ncbi:protein of unknown function [Burkholderia multivorans]
MPCPPRADGLDEGATFPPAEPQAGASLAGTFGESRLPSRDTKLPAATQTVASVVPAHTADRPPHELQLSAFTHGRQIVRPGFGYDFEIRLITDDRVKYD